GRRAQIFEYSMTPEERSLYDDVTTYLLQPQLYAFRGSQRQLLLISFHRLMASSVPALARSLMKVAERLKRLLMRGSSSQTDGTLLAELEEEDVEIEEEEREAPEPRLVKAELERVLSFITRADALPRDSKADKLLEVMNVIRQRLPERGRLV